VNAETTSAGPVEPAGDVDAAGVEWWTSDQVIAYLAGTGKQISESTWRSYVARGQAPAAGRHIRRTPQWAAAAVRDWDDNRRGQGWRAGTTSEGREHLRDGL
jgi:hypothetical protein